MDKVNLPVPTANEPVEEARQPEVSSETMSLQNKLEETNVSATPLSAEITKTSQTNSASQNHLSQPGGGLSHRQRLQWLQDRHSPGLWAQCDDCSRWRFLPKVLDSHELPNKWYCKMNPDKTMADCGIPEVPISVRDEEDLIYSLYSAGSLVWARLPGWPWWPAMVDDCPDSEQFYWLDGFSDIPTHYHVVFFDTYEVTRAWIAPQQLKPYKSYRNNFKLLSLNDKFKVRLEAATKQADDAEKLTATNRLKKYSFIARYRGPINTPKKVNQKRLIKYKKQLKRKYNVEFHSDDSAAESEAESFEKQQSVAVNDCNNKIILGNNKATRSAIPKHMDLSD